MRRQSVYLLYPSRSLLGRRQRTIFSIFVIAISVTAIVSIGIMTESSEKTLVGNVKSIIGGDIAITYMGTEEGGIGLEIDSDLRAFMDNLEKTGEIERWTYLNQTIRGTRSQDPSVTQNFVGLQGIREEYPLYGKIPIVEPVGASLESLIADPGDVVINEILAENLKLKVGDTLLVLAECGECEFRVTGIVKESRGVGNVFGVALMRYEVFKTTVDIDSDLATDILIQTENDDLMREVERKTKEYFDDRRMKVSIDNYLNTTSTIVEQLGPILTFFKLAGILSLFVGAVGIITTMLITMKERRMEIGVMKTVGIKSRDVMIFFLIESAFVGTAGSLVGILTGIAASRALVLLMEGLFLLELNWIVTPNPIVFGIFVGIISTIGFGMAPAYLASKTRPNIVLKEREEKTPLWKDVKFIGVILAMVALFGIIVYTTFKDFLYLFVVYGFILGGVIQVVLLRYLLKFVSRAPTFGIMSIKMALRNIERQKWMMATTLLAIITGVGLVGSILMTGENVKSTFADAISGAFGYDLQVWGVPYVDLNKAMSKIGELSGVTELYPELSVSPTLDSVNDKPIDEILSNFPDAKKDYLENNLTAIVLGYDLERKVISKTMIAGRNLDTSDTGKDHIIIDNVFSANFEIGVDDNVTFALDGNRAAFKVVGVYDRGFFGGPPTTSICYTSFATVNDIARTSVNVDIDITEVNGKKRDDLRTKINVVDLRRIPQDYPIVAGRPLSVRDRNTLNCVVSAPFATLLGVGVGDTVRVDSYGKSAELTVVGLSPGLFNRKATLIASYDALSEAVPYVHIVSISVSTTDASQRSVAKSIQSLLPDTYVFDLSQINVVISSLLDQSTIPITVLASFSLMVGSLIIANSIYMAALDRRREIGVMKALGAKRRDILYNMTVENLIIGFIGGVIGDILVVLLSFILGGLFGAEIHFTFQPLIIVGMILISLGIAAVASVIPAYNAAKVKPLVALKYE